MRENDKSPPDANMCIIVWSIRYSHSIWFCRPNNKNLGCHQWTFHPQLQGSRRRFTNPSLSHEQVRFPFHTRGHVFLWYGNAAFIARQASCCCSLPRTITVWGSTTWCRRRPIALPPFQSMSAHLLKYVRLLTPLFLSQSGAIRYWCKWLLRIPHIPYVLEIHTLHGLIEIIISNHPTHLRLRVIIGIILCIIISLVLFRCKIIIVQCLNHLRFHPSLLGEIKHRCTSTVKNVLFVSCRW